MNETLQKKRVLVIGLGASGLSAAHLLLEKGLPAEPESASRTDVELILNDYRDAVEGLEPFRERSNVRIVLGGHPSELLDGLDLIVLSPGVPELPILREADARSIPIVGEVELASWSIESSLVAITGTNGKSTVTSLLGAIAEAAGERYFMGGNLGVPLSELARMDDAPELGIVELSSYQLERVDRFRAEIAILLNLSDDHLDRYEDFGAYAAAKGAIFKNQGPGDVAIVRVNDALSASLARVGRGKVERYLDPEGVHIAQGEIVDAVSGFRFPLSELALLGKHNHENACAAVLAARHLGFEDEVIARALRTFRGLPHRMMRVDEIEERLFIDDSKATNVGSTLAALEGLRDHPGAIVLIAGGKDKGGSYAPLAPLAKEKLRALVALGEARPLLSNAFSELTEVRLAETMAEAVPLAFQLSRPGDLILLSPACSSLDQYRSYIERGENFAEAVGALKERRNRELNGENGKRSER